MTHPSAPRASRSRFVCLSLSGLLLMTAATIADDAASESLPDGVTKVASVEGFTEYRLDNGYRVLLFPDSSKPVVTVNNTIFVGSRHEGYGEAGMAHLLEHMLFKGTPDHPEVPKVLQERGAQFNGTTWVDRTNYYETLPASDENLEFAIRLEADRMVNSFVKQEDLDSEMTVVRNEFERGENSPSRVLQQKMLAAAYEWHNYGQSTIGNRADIERVPIDSLRAFYRKYYQPDNAMLIVAGKFDRNTALEYIAKYFGALPKPERALPQTYTEEPAQDGERIVRLTRVGEVPLIGVMYHIPSGGHPDYVAIDVLESIMTMSPNGRLYKALVKAEKASSISGTAYAWHDPGVIRFAATIPAEGSPELALDTLGDVVQEVRESGVTQEEVDRARTRLLKQFELILADSRNLALQMSEWQAMGDWRLFFLYRDRLEQVTPADVQRVAQDYLTRTNRTVGFFLPTEKPQRTSIPQTPDLAAIVSEYKGREVVDAGEDFDTAPLAIEARTERTTLKSGIEAALLPKKTRGNLVQFRLTLRFGNEENLNGRSAASELLGTMLARGTEKLSRQEIQDEQDRLRAQISLSSSAGSLTVSAKTKRDSLSGVIDLIEQILREPTFPDDELQTLKAAKLTNLQQSLNDPQTLAFRWVARQLNPYDAGHPRYIETVEEEIADFQAVTTDSLKELHSQFLGGTEGQLAIVGDFDRNAIVPQVEAMLADWTAEEGYARLESKPHTPENGEYQQIETPDKENAVYFSGEVVRMADTHPDYPALALGNFIFGGGSLSSRLGDRVRQQEGLSYGVGSFFRASSFDPRASMNLYAITNPTNAAKLRKVIAEELDKLLTDGVTDEEVARAKDGYLQSLAVSRASDSSLASTLVTQLHVGRDMEYQAKLEERIRSLTAEEINTALKKWIEPGRFFTSIAGDFTKAEPAEAADN